MLEWMTEINGTHLEVVLDDAGLGYQAWLTYEPRKGRVAVVTTDTVDDPAGALQALEVLVRRRLRERKAKRARRKKRRAENRKSNR